MHTDEKTAYAKRILCSWVEWKHTQCKIWGFHGSYYEECRLLGCDAVWPLWELTFRGMYHLHHQSEKNQRARNNVSTNQQLKHSVKECSTACFICWLLLMLFLARWFFSPSWWRRYVPPKGRLSQGPHGVTSQKTAFLKKHIPFAFTHLCSVLSLL
jgi:hypothetical protein